MNSYRYSNTSTSSWKDALCQRRGFVFKCALVLDIHPVLKVGDSYVAQACSLVTHESLRWGTAAGGINASLTSSNTSNVRHGLPYRSLKSILTQFIYLVVPLHTWNQKNEPEGVLDALKSILDRHLDLFVFLEAKMQGYNRAPLLDRLNRYSQVAFFVQFVNTGFY